MRAVIQLVKKSSVIVDDHIVGKIDRGLLVLLGVNKDDSKKDVHYMVEKIVNLRIFPDDDGKMNLSVCDIKGKILAVSQFTLLGDCRKGRRPSYSKAAPPKMANSLYEQFVEKMRKHLPVETGTFQALMEVELINDGPITLIIDSEKQF